MFIHIFELSNDKKESDKKRESEENERKTKRQVSFYAKASDVKSVFLYKPAYICTHVQKDMF